MKRILAATSIAALALVGSAGAAHAAPSERACFGGVHKAINTEGLLTDMGIDNVGQAIKALGGGQEKNAVARACRG